MQHAGHQYGQGAVPSSQYQPPQSSPGGNSITSSLRQWRKKDSGERHQHAQPQPATSEAPAVSVENSTHVARVAPQTHYTRSTNELYGRYPPQYPEYGLAYKETPQTPVKYSEIVETPRLEHLGPIIPDPKEKDYVKMCSVQQPHLKQFPDQMHLKQTYSDAMKPSSYDPNLQYVPKEAQYQYQQMMPKYNMQQQYVRNYGAESNNFLASLNKINPQIAHSIMNDPHIRDTQVSMYRSLDQPPSYSHHQRVYRTSPPMHSNPTYHRNIPQPYNYPQGYGYNSRLQQYQLGHSPQNYQRSMSPRRGYQENSMPLNLNYASMPTKMSPGYPPQCGQLEYSQHYQHRRMQMQNQEYFQQNYKNAYLPNQQGPSDATDGPVVASNNIKQFLENWNEEDVAVSLPDLIMSSNTGENDKLQLVKGPLRVKEDGTSEQPLFVFETAEIPGENLPQYLHVQQIDKLPENIRGYYENGSLSIGDAGRIIIKAPTERNAEPKERINIIENRRIIPPQEPENVVNLHIVESNDGSNTQIAKVTAEKSTWNEENVPPSNTSEETDDKSPKSMPDIEEKSQNDKEEVNEKQVDLNQNLTAPKPAEVESSQEKNSFQNFTEFQEKFATFVERVKKQITKSKSVTPDPVHGKPEESSVTETNNNSDTKDLNIPEEDIPIEEDKNDDKNEHSNIEDIEEREEITEEIKNESIEIIDVEPSKEEAQEASSKEEATLGEPPEIINESVEEIEDVKEAPKEENEAGSNEEQVVISEEKVENEEILVDIPDMPYRKALRIENNNVLLYIDNELIEININNINGKKFINVVPLTGAIVVNNQQHLIAEEDTVDKQEQLTVEDIGMTLMEEELSNDTPPMELIEDKLHEAQILEEVLQEEMNVENIGKEEVINNSDFEEIESDVDPPTVVYKEVCCVDSEKHVDEGKIEGIPEKAEEYHFDSQENVEEKKIEGTPKEAEVCFVDREDIVEEEKIEEMPCVDSEKNIEEISKEIEEVSCVDTKRTVEENVKEMPNEVEKTVAQVETAEKVEEIFNKSTEKEEKMVEERAEEKAVHFTTKASRKHFPVTEVSKKKKCKGVSKTTDSLVMKKTKEKPKRRVTFTAEPTIIQEDENREFSEPKKVDTENLKSTLKKFKRPRPEGMPKLIPVKEIPAMPNKLNVQINLDVLEKKMPKIPKMVKGTAENKLQEINLFEKVTNKSKLKNGEESCTKIELDKNNFTEATKLEENKAVKNETTVKVKEKVVPVIPSKEKVENKANEKVDTKTNEKVGTEANEKVHTKTNEKVHTKTNEKVDYKTTNGKVDTKTIEKVTTTGKCLIEKTDDKLNTDFIKETVDVQLGKNSNKPLIEPKKQIQSYKITETKVKLFLPINRMENLKVYSRESAQKRRLSLQEYNSRKQRISLSRQGSLSASIETKVPSVPITPKPIEVGKKIVIDIHNFDIAPNISDDSVKSVKDEIDSKLNSLEIQIPKVRQVSECLVKNQSQWIRENDSLMRRFLNREVLTPLEVQKVTEIIKCKRVLEEINKAKMLKQITKDTNLKNDTNLKVHYKKKRFRNLYAIESDSDEELCGKSYLAYQSQAENGIPKIIIKRKFCENEQSMQPFVRLVRSPSIDMMAKRRKTYK